MKKKAKACLHVIGSYFHSSSELCDFCTPKDIDGEGTIAGYYSYCNKCGTKITKAIIKKQMEEK